MLISTCVIADSVYLFTNVYIYNPPGSINVGIFSGWWWWTVLKRNALDVEMLQVVLILNILVQNFVGKSSKLIKHTLTIQQLKIET